MMDNLEVIAQKDRLLQEAKKEASYRRELNSPLELTPPKSVAELCARLDNLLGRSVAELSSLAGINTPYNNTSGKGFTGLLLEIFLGANARSLPEPDFIDLGIELKSLPVGFNLSPNEDTYLSMADINPERHIPFEHSSLYSKVRDILFVVVLAPRGLKISERRIMGYFFFRPNDEQMKVFKQDYDEFNELILSSRAREITGSLGNYIHMRPKGRKNDATVAIRDENGELTYTYSRGYYLRKSFTKELLNTFMQEQGIDEDKLKELYCLKDALLQSGAEDLDEAAEDSEGEELLDEAPESTLTSLNPTNPKPQAPNFGDEESEVEEL